MRAFADLERIPGSGIVQRGVEDLDGGRETAEALLVSIGAPRLRSLGVEVSVPIASPEHKLYRLLGRERGDGGHVLARHVAAALTDRGAVTRRARSEAEPQANALRAVTQRHIGL